MTKLHGVVGVAALGLFLGLIGGSVRTYAEDRDTIPLKKKTSPNPKTETTESKIMTAPRNGQAVNVPGPQNPGPYIAAFDTFGSARINEGAAREFLGKDLTSWFDKGLKKDPTAVDLEAKLKEKIKGKWGFPFAEFSIVQYYEAASPAIYITLDVVESKDIAKRMPFKTFPTQQFPDPDNLIQSWLEYEDTALNLIEQRQLEPNPTDCPAFHCPFGHKHVKLKKYEKLFVEGVRKNESVLAQIMAKDSRPDFRGAACFLLAYLKDGKKVVTYMIDRVKDPDELVRNNALRVLGDLAEYHPEYPLPLKPVLEALDFPRVSDRSKAVYVVFHLASNSRQARDAIMETAVPDLMAMMESKQPDHQEFSHGILRKISGKDFAVGDLRSWRNWYAKLQADRGVANK